MGKTAGVCLIEVGPAERMESLVDALMGVWRSSVEATHDFLSPAEVDAIAEYVPGALREIPRLVVALAGGAGEEAAGADVSADGAVGAGAGGTDGRAAGFGEGCAGGSLCPVAFAGVADDSLEMLFVAPDMRGWGVGGRLLRHAIEQLGVHRLDVNEQNPQARGFYEHEGFRVVGRSETDAQGGPYPILHMELARA